MRTLATLLLLTVTIAACAADARVDELDEPATEEVFATAERVRIYDEEGRQVTFTSRPAEERRVIERAVNNFVSRTGGREPLGCQLGPDISISCWGFGSMCAVWFDEDGFGGQCWDCELADCG